MFFSLLHLFQLLHIVIDAVQLFRNVDFLRAMLGALVASGKLDVSPLSTHVFHGWEHTPEALEMMRNKAPDLIKPVIIIEE